MLFASLVLLGVGALAYSNGRAALETATTADLLSTAIEKEAALNAWIEDQQRDITALANSPDLRDDVAALLAARPGSNEAQEAYNRVLRGFQIWTGPDRQYLALLVIKPDTGQVLAATNPAEKGQFFTDRLFFINGRRGPYVQNVYYSPILQAPAMTAVAPLRSADGRLLAVLAGHLNLEELNAIVNRRTGLHQTDDALVVNAAGIFVTQPRFLPDPVVLRQAADTLPIRRCLTRTSGVVSAGDYRGVPVIAVYRWLADREMCLIIKLEQAEAFAPIRAFGRTILVAGGLLLAGAVLLALALARTITRPVLALQAGAVRLRQGDRTVRLPETSTDELGHLAREFNTLAATLAEQEAHLHRHNEELEQTVQERTATLQASEAKFRNALDAMLEGCQIIDFDWRYLYLNEVADKHNRRPKETLLGQKYMDMWPGIEATEVFAVIRWCMEAREPQFMENKFTFPDGSEGYFELKIYPVPEGIVILSIDITERKRAETALRESEARVRLKLDSILAPEGDIGHLELADIIDAPQIQSLMDDFYTLAHIPMSIMDLKGNLLVGVGWQRICMRFHRVHHETCAFCLKSDTQLTTGIPSGEFKLYKCKNNMWDMATPILLGGQHVGNLFSGQFFFDDEQVDEELFRAQARQYGFDEAEYLTALEQAPRLSREAVDRGITFFMKLAHMLSLLSYSNIKLARSLAERDALMESLRESEERYRSLFQNNQSVMLLIDPETGAIVNANPAACVFYGYSREEITRLKITDINQLTYEQVFAEMERAKNEQRRQFFFRHRLASGEMREVEVYSGPIEFTGKRLLYSIVHDITERKRAEAALKAALAKAEEGQRTLAALMEYVPEGITIANAPEVTIRHVSRYGQDLLGGVHQDLTAGQVAEQWTIYEANGTTLLPEADLPLVRAICQGETVRDKELVQVNAQGRALTLLCNAAPIRDQSGQIVAGIVAWRDITERKRAEEALRESERRYRTIGETIPYGVWLTDATGYCTYVSDSFLDLVGMTMEQVQQFGWLHLLPPEDVRPTQEHWLQCVETGAHFEREHRFRTRDGNYRHVLAIGRPVRDERGQITCWVGLNLDITERKRAEAEIRQLNESLENRVRERTVQLEAANKELEAFAYSVSHDLRAPLRGIDGFSQALLEDCAPQLNDRGQHYLRRVRAASQRMGQLIDDLLTLSRLTRSEMRRETVNLSELAQAIAAELRQTEPDRQVEFLIAPGVAAEADARLIRVALENLFGNAWKFTAKHPSARIEFGLLQHNGRPAYFVRDDGAGFDMTYADKLFGAFQRLHTPAEFSGNGIGLATVQRVIHRHGGQVWVEGQVEHGATFYFTL